MTPLCALFPCTFSFVFVRSNASCSWCSLALGVWESDKAFHFPLPPSDKLSDAFGAELHLAGFCLVNYSAQPYLGALCSLSGIIALRGHKTPVARAHEPQPAQQAARGISLPQISRSQWQAGFFFCFSLWSDARMV